MSVSMLERGRNKLERHPQPQASAEPRGLRRSRPSRRRRRRELQRRHDGSARDRLRARRPSQRAHRLHVDQRVRRRTSPGKGMDTIFQALSGVMQMAGERGRRAGAERRSVRRSDRPAVRGDRNARRAAACASDRAGPARRRLAARRAHCARRDASRGARWSGPASRCGRATRSRDSRRSASSRRSTATSRSARRRDAFARGVFEALGRPELVDDERFSSRDRRVANAAELHARDRPSGPRSARRQRLLRRSRRMACPPPSCAGRRTPCATACPRARRGRPHSSHPRLGHVDDLSAAACRSGSRTRASATASGAAPRRAQRTRLRRAASGYDAERVSKLRADGVV